MRLVDYTFEPKSNNRGHFNKFKNNVTAENILFQQKCKETIGIGERGEGGWGLGGGGDEDEDKKNTK